MAAPRAAKLHLGDGLSLPLDMVTEATAIVATRGAGKSSASTVIVEEAFALGVQTVIFDRTGVYWGLRSNAKGDDQGLDIYVLGGPHGDVPLEPTAGAMVADLIVDSGHSFRRSIQRANSRCRACTSRISLRARAAVASGRLRGKRLRRRRFSNGRQAHCRMRRWS